MNPCPCGRRGSRALPVLLHAGEVRSYLGRLSGPLLDRIDLHVSVPALASRGGPREESRSRGPGAGGAARERQNRPRSAEAHPAWERRPGPRPRDVERWCGPQSVRLRRLRSIDSGRRPGPLPRVRVARTIADLADSDEVRTQDLAEALGYRRCAGDTAEPR